MFYTVKADRSFEFLIGSFIQLKVVVKNRTNSFVVALSHNHRVLRSFNSIWTTIHHCFINTSVVDSTLLAHRDAVWRPSPSTHSPVRYYPLTRNLCLAFPPHKRPALNFTSSPLKTVGNKDKCTEEGARIFGCKIQQVSLFWKTSTTSELIFIEIL